jgi:hypothetical protein
MPVLLSVLLQLFKFKKKKIAWPQKDSTVQPRSSSLNRSSTHYNMSILELDFQ